MKLALVFLASLVSTHATMDTNTIKPNHLLLDHPFSKFFKPVARGCFRIVGGQEVTAHSFPYQVGLKIFSDGGESFCGGSLISPTTVLTAAHCTENTKKIIAMFGQHDLRTEDGTQLQVDKIIIHPAWNSSFLINDIAILRFDRKIELNEYIKAVSLPTHADILNDFTGEMATASGWGKDSDRSSSICPVLRSVDVALMTNNDCKIAYGSIIQPTHLCTNSSNGRATCSGDSGGPLVYNGKLIGITSFGVSMGCEIGYPAVYTRITEYLDWIEQNSDLVIERENHDLQLIKRKTFEFLKYEQTKSKKILKYVESEERIFLRMSGHF